MGEVKDIGLSVDDRELLENISRCDDAAFESLFRMHYQSLCIHASKLILDDDTAEEIVQDIFLKFWDKRASLEITTGLKPYLYRSVHNRCLDHRRAGPCAC